MVRWAPRDLREYNVRGALTASLRAISMHASRRCHLGKRGGRNVVGLFGSPAPKPTSQHLVRLLQPRAKDWRVVLPRGGYVLVTEPALDVTQIDPALAELQRDAVSRLIRTNILRPASGVQLLRVVAGVEVAPGVRVGALLTRPSLSSAADSPFLAMPRQRWLNSGGCFRKWLRGGAAIGTCSCGVGRRERICAMLTG
jgi:hypothetical protein